MKHKLATAPQILEHYLYKKFKCYPNVNQIQACVEAMRSYAKYKSDKAYEEWFQTALKMLNNDLK